MNETATRSCSTFPGCWYTGDYPNLKEAVLLVGVKPNLIKAVTFQPTRFFPRIQVAQLWIHILFWSLFIASEYFANLVHLQAGDYWPFFRATLLSLPALMLSAYVIVWYVVPRFLSTNKWPIFLLWIALIGTIVFLARLEWQHLVNYLNHGYEGRIPASKVIKNVIRDYSIIALAVCVSIIADYRRKQVLNEQLAQSKAEAEIKLLKGQLHPHFLFNSLNNIYSLALMRSELTADSILKLTELLDYLIYRANLDKVPLSEEVDLLENYIGLERLRYSDRLKISTDFQSTNERIPVAPLLLLPFAENCFKHGGPGPDGFFRVSMYLRATDEQLIFRIHNNKKRTGAGVPKAGGIGLQNIRQRLELLYPGRHQLQIRDLRDRFEVDLQIAF